MVAFSRAGGVTMIASIFARLRLGAFGLAAVRTLTLTGSDPTFNVFHIEARELGEFIRRVHYPRQARACDRRARARLFGNAH
jgi:hypothetical protein